MHGECALLFECMRASRKLAFPRLLAGVYSHMLVERLLCRQLQATNGTFHRLIPCVGLYMAFQLALLAEHCRSGTILPLAAKSRVLPSHVLQMIILCVVMQVIGILELHVADFAIR